MKKIPDPKKMKRISGPRVGKRALEIAKVRITTYLDKAVVDKLRQLSAKSSGKYQTLLNQVLRRYLLGDQDEVLNRIRRLENAVFHSKAA